MRHALLALVAALCLTQPVSAQITRINRVADASGAVTTGGTSQTVAAADADRSMIICQNPIASTEPIFIDFGRAASSSASGGSIQLAPGGTLSVLGNAVPTTTITVTSATTGTRYVCKFGFNQ